MANMHFDDKRGLRQRVFESVAGDMQVSLGEWRAEGLDEFSLVETLQEAINKLRFLSRGARMPRIPQIVHSSSKHRSRAPRASPGTLADSAPSALWRPALA